MPIFHTGIRGIEPAAHKFAVLCMTGAGSDVTSRSVRVVNQLGLHARAAARFVHLATKFESHIRVSRDTKVMDGKSIMGILLLAAGRGTTLTITADGRDEDDAADALARLVESGFGEESWNG